MDEYVRFSGSQVMIDCFFGGGGGFTMFTVIGGIGPVEVFWDNCGIIWGYSSWLRPKWGVIMGQWGVVGGSVGFSRVSVGITPTQ